MHHLNSDPSAGTCFEVLDNLVFHPKHYVEVFLSPQCFFDAEGDIVHTKMLVHDPALGQMALLNSQNIWLKYDDNRRKLFGRPPLTGGMVMNLSLHYYDQLNTYLLHNFTLNISNAAPTLNESFAQNCSGVPNQFLVCQYPISEIFRDRDNDDLLISVQFYNASVGTFNPLSEFTAGHFQFSQNSSAHSFQVYGVMRAPGTILMRASCTDRYSDPVFYYFNCTTVNSKPYYAGAGSVLALPVHPGTELHYLINRDDFLDEDDDRVLFRVVVASNASQNHIEVNAQYPWLTFDAEALQLRGNLPTDLRQNISNLTLLFYDQYTAAEPENLLLFLQYNNSQPSNVKSIPDQLIHFGQEFQVHLSSDYFYDADNDAIFFELYVRNEANDLLDPLTVRPWIRLDQTQLLISGATTDAAYLGITNLTVVFTDRYADAVYLNVSVTITNALPRPLPAASFNLTLNSYYLSVLRLNDLFIDDDGDELYFDVFALSGDGVNTVPFAMLFPGIALLVDQNGQHTLSGKFESPMTDQKFTISYRDFYSGYQNQTLFISIVNQPPRAISLPNSTQHYQKAFSIYVFRQDFYDPEDDSLFFQAKVLEGGELIDLNLAAPWLTFDQSDFRFYGQTDNAAHLRTYEIYL